MLFAGFLLVTKKDTILANLAEAAAKNPASGALSLCTCFWKREIDYQPPSGGLDIGVCASETPDKDGSVLLRETGDDANYSEGWFRHGDTVHGPFMALELISKERKGYWVRAGKNFAYAVGRPVETVAGCHEKSNQIASQVGKKLPEAVKELVGEKKEAMLDLAASYLCVAGEVIGDSWKILHSTNPELVQCNLLGGDQKLCCSHLKSEPGGIVTQILATEVGMTPAKREWKIVEMDESSLSLE